MIDISSFHVTWKNLMRNNIYKIFFIKPLVQMKDLQVGKLIIAKNGNDKVKISVKGIITQKEFEKDLENALQWLLMMNIKAVVFEAGSLNIPDWFSDKLKEAGIDIEFHTERDTNIKSIIDNIDILTSIFQKLPKTLKTAIGQYCIKEVIRALNRETLDEKLRHCNDICPYESTLKEEAEKNGVELELIKEIIDLLMSICRVISQLSSEAAGFFKKWLSTIAEEMSLGFYTGTGSEIIAIYREGETASYKEFAYKLLKKAYDTDNEEIRAEISVMLAGNAPKTDKVKNILKEGILDEKKSTLLRESFLWILKSSFNPGSKPDLHNYNIEEKKHDVLVRDINNLTDE